VPGTISNRDAPVYPGWARTVIRIKRWCGCSGRPQIAYEL